MVPPKDFDTNTMMNFLASMGDHDPSMLQHTSFMERLMDAMNTGPFRIPSELSRSYSASSELSSSLRELAEIRANNERERSLPAVRIRPWSKEVVLSGFQEPEEGNEQEGQIRQTIIGMPWGFSQSNLIDLKRINLKDMLVRKTHKGFYFLGRVVSGIYSIVAIHLILEDPEGHATLVAFYNYPTSFNSSIATLKPIFALGSVWAIKEPTYKFSSDQANAMIRVDSPSDIVPIAFDDKLLQSVRWSSGISPSIPQPPASVEACRLKGAEEFKAQRWLAAAVRYTEGLKLDKNSVIMHLNRSETYIRLGWYNSALADAQWVVDFGVQDASLLRKAIFRAAKCSYYLTDYEQSMVYADMLPEDKDCADWKAKATSRIRERESGNYDWCALYQGAQAECYRPDVADFCGPVEVREGGNGIRGLFSTRDVKIGEVLLASKSIASYYPEDNSIVKKEIFISLNLLTDEMTDKSRPAIIAAIGQKMWDDGQLELLIKSLYAGPERLPPIAFIPSVGKSTTQLLHPLNSKVSIDISRIEGATSFNVFSLEQVSPPKFKYTHGSGDASEHGTGLYGLASFCNHSCLPSARRAFYGDFIVIRAVQPIKAGEEITIEYVDGASPLSERRKLSRWKFSCSCALCTADSEDGECADILRENVMTTWSPSDVSIAESARKLEQVRGVYCNTPERRACRNIKPILASAYHNYAHTLGKHAMRGQTKHATPSIKAEMEGLEAVRMRITDKSTSGPTRTRQGLPVDTKFGPSHRPMFCAMSVLQIVATFSSLGDTLRAKSWMKVACWLNDIEVGGGSELFKLRYATILKEMFLSGLANEAL